MQTSQLITLAKKQFPDFSREMLLGFLNELQRIIFTQRPVNQMRRIDSTTGKDYLLTTVTGTYEYTITGAWRVTKVYDTYDEDDAYAIFFDAAPGGYARIIFKEDPGTLNYYVTSYRFPNELVTENTPLEGPDAFHLSHLFEGLCGIIEKFRSGKSERWDVFELKLLPELVKKLSDNHTSNHSFTTYRGY